MILIGDSSVGKTCIFKKLTTGVFLEKNISTIGIDRRTLTFDIEINENGQTTKRNVDVSLMDTAGEERFKAITKTYFKGSDGILLLYDITNKESFENVENWIKSIQESIGDASTSKYIVVLLGNKLDLVENQEKERSVSTEELEASLSMILPILASSSIRFFLLCRRPAVSHSTTSTPRAFAAASESNSTAPGSAPSLERTISQSARFAQISS